MTVERPKLRALEAIPEEIEGRLMLLLRDPRGITDQVAALPPPLARFLVEMCDGTRALPEIEAEFESLGGDRLGLTDILSKLDEALLLDSARYRAKLAELTEEYRGGGPRPVAEIQAYPSNVREFLDGLYQGLCRTEAAEPLRALAIPHLDLRYGGAAAARGLHGLGETFEGDTVVILGVGHSLASCPYALTGKDFETPVGTVRLARELFDRVVRSAGSWLLDEELVHRGEHSLEYAATLLRHTLGEREFRILPVACGSFHQFLDEGRSPAEDPMIDVFLETLAEEAGDCLLLASVDLAHMGPYYGDSFPLTSADLEEIEREDRAMLTRMADRDAEGFFGSLAAVGDRRRVCGLSALYTLLSLLPEGPEGRLLGYEQPVFPAEGNTVTICSMAWTK